MPKMRLTWKWKLTLAIVALLFFLLYWVLSDTGHNWMKKQIIARMEALPAAEQRDSAWAGPYLWLAWWAGVIRGETKEASDMYMEFCGFGKSREGKVPFDQYGYPTGKFCGLCRLDGSTGWGPLHPRAPEAYFAYLDMVDPRNSNNTRQFFYQDIFKYYRVFYDWWISHTPNHLPHPQFNIYWAKIMYRLGDEPVWWPQDIDRKASRAPPVPKEDLPKKE